MKKNIFFTVLFILFISKIEASNFKTDFLYSRSFNSITTLPINVVENDQVEGENWCRLCYAQSNNTGTSVTVHCYRAHKHGRSCEELQKILNDYLTKKEHYLD